ncbi:MAG: transcriptional repressor LexA [Oscillospiraceae bacterium]|nr:transcriptional repressor LexA [Oscillospiraceae bacterium]
MGRTSDKQEKILQFLNTYMEENGYAPSVREICAAVGLKSTATVSYHLNELKRQGMIEGDSTKRRAISLPESRKAGRIPLVGVVTAGMPILAVENIEGSVPWDGDPSCYALRIKGDSMIGAGILNGDVVVVRPQPEASNGEIVIAMIEDEATCKRFHRGSDGVWLLPENPAYEPINGTNAAILGKVKAVIREY